MLDKASIWRLIGVMRKYVSLPPAQHHWLKAKAKRLGISETEVIRRLIDKARGEEVGR